MDSLIDRKLHGQGTAEDEWLAWSAWRDLPAATAEDLVPPGFRAVMVAPHPDDEVLAVGGLLSQCVALGRDVRLVAVTDGTASHPRSTQWPPERLARARPLESQEACRRLGLRQADVVRLQLPDGGVAGQQALLAQRLSALLMARDVVFTTWRLDGHPDHEATARACIEAAERTGAHLIEVPVWGWHWARPAEASWPWPRARRVELDAATAQRKREAVRAFASQLESDPSTGAPPILLASTVQRAARMFEVVFA